MVTAVVITLILTIKADVSTNTAYMLVINLPENLRIKVNTILRTNT